MVSIVLKAIHLLMSDRPYFAYQNTRNLKRSDPKDCSLIHVEKYNYFLINQDLVMGEIWYCD